HQLAAALVTGFGRDLIVPVPVIAEADHLVRSRVGPGAARLLLGAIAAGEHRVAELTPALLRRAAEIDAQHADLDLGFVDAAVMAIAERHELPILTFDFGHFRATRPWSGYWRLVVDEARYADETG
ncbi:MAG: type II toxin-antitoxin system VapC family toxin, partial [Gaiellaceae bacterium]